MILAAPLIPPFAQAVGITAGSLGLIGLTKKVNDYIRANPKESMEIIKLISPGVAGISTLFENKKRGIGDNNPPSPIEEEKPPQQEPPKEPNIGEEVLTASIIKNKIQTWEKYMSQDEAEKAVKENNITLKDLEIPALKKQITFRKNGNDFDILFDRKVVGELQDITQFKQEDGSQKGNERSYNLSLINEDGYNGEAFDTLDGQAFAKDEAKDTVARDLLRDTQEPRYPSLKDIFQNIEYNKKGIPKKVAEESEIIRKQVEKNKKALGGLIDKPLLGRSRDI
jgi:hypothetical protein